MCEILKVSPFGYYKWYNNKDKIDDEENEIGYNPSLKLVIKTINQVKDKALEYGTFFHSD